MMGGAHFQRGKVCEELVRFFFFFFSRGRWKKREALSFISLFCFPSSSIARPPCDGLCSSASPRERHDVSFRSDREHWQQEDRRRTAPHDAIISTASGNADADADDHLGEITPRESPLRESTLQGQRPPRPSGALHRPSGALRRREAQAQGKVSNVFRD